MSNNQTAEQERETGEHHFGMNGGEWVCLTCGCDEDDAFCGAEECTYKAMNTFTVQVRPNDDKDDLWPDVWTVEHENKSAEDFQREWSESAIAANPDDWNLDDMVTTLRASGYRITMAADILKLEY